MRKELAKLVDVATSCEQTDARTNKAVQDFAKALIKHGEEQEREMARIKGDIKRGSRAGSGKFSL
jgi:hypothetical protein